MKAFMYNARSFRFFDSQHKLMVKSILTIFTKTVEVQKVAR